MTQSSIRMCLAAFVLLWACPALAYGSHPAPPAVPPPQPPAAAPDIKPGDGKGAEIPRIPEVPPGAAEEERAVQAFGAANPTCAEWTDGCIVCLKGTSDAPSCSLPGIACEPKPAACKPPAAQK